VAVAAARLSSPRGQLFFHAVQTVVNARPQKSLGRSAGIL